MTYDQNESTKQSGKYYKVNLEGDKSVYSPSREPPTHIETSPLVTPLSNPWLGKNSPTPPPPPEDDIATHMKLPKFKGVGDEDMDRVWLVAESLWTTQNVASDVVKRARLSLAFEGRALDWFMGYVGQHIDLSIHENKDALK